MFDSIINAPRHIHVDVTEKRAPTDESVRLFGELQQKAIDQVLTSGRERMSINDIQWTLINRPEIRTVQLALSFYVNGNQCSGVIDIDTLDIRCSRDKVTELQRVIVEGVHEAVTREVTGDLFRTMGNEIIMALES